MAHAPLHLLCVEPQFPGRLGPVVDWLVRKRGYRCRFYCHSVAPRERWPSSVGRGLEVGVFKVGGVARERSVPWQRILEYYKIRAQSAGYSTEQQTRGADQVLGGTNERDGGAYYVIVTPKQGGSEVSMLSNNGR